MEELASAAKPNAENTDQAIRLAMSANQIATKGSAVVAAMVDTMATIHVASRQIFEIIGVIDGIAFQTNILTLNAAVVEVSWDWRGAPNYRAN